MLIAVDHGNYSIKTPNFSFVAGLAEHTVPPPILDDCIEYAGRYWTLSESRIFYMRDKTQDDRYFILTLFAIATTRFRRRLQLNRCIICHALQNNLFFCICKRFSGK